MKIKRYPFYLLMSFACGSVFLARGANSDLAAVKEVVITVNDNMKFSVDEIDASPGQSIRVQLKNQGTLPKEAMGHNWVLLKAGYDPETYLHAALTKKNENYQPVALANETIASIGLLGAHESGEATFNAPTEPGKYVFLCSFPGHFQIGMKGTLVVK